MVPFFCNADRVRFALHDEPKPDIHEQFRGKRPESAFASPIPGICVYKRIRKRGPKEVTCTITQLACILLYSTAWILIPRYN